jgi:succinate dehydrogenase / fumarate reductase, iron-sulfur subunit
MSDQSVHVKIKRQDGPDKESYWEDFRVPYQKSMNIIAVLMEIQKNPINAQGKRTSPVLWDCSCLEEVCGACTMVINGKVRQSCSALVDQLEQPIRLEPMTKFPTVRDLRVDRTRMFDALKKVKAWIPIDGTYDLGPGPRLSPDTQAIGYELSRCMTCGCCLEACPQINENSPFIGAAAISQARLFNMHPSGAMQKDQRIDALLEEGGLESCGNAQNCVEACPKDIPLTESIAVMEWEATKRAFKKLLGM